MPNRRKATLIPLLDKWLPNNCALITDEFSSYVNIHTESSNIIEELPHKNIHHYWVNHSIGYKI